VTVVKQEQAWREVVAALFCAAFLADIAFIMMRKASEPASRGQTSVAGRGGDQQQRGKFIVDVTHSLPPSCVNMACSGSWLLLFFWLSSTSRHCAIRFFV
jgi:hypothetical protein